MKSHRSALTMLMGRNTYHMFSKIWASSDSDYSAAIYHMRKYVFSSTLSQADWNNTAGVNARSLPRCAS